MRVLYMNFEFRGGDASAHGEEMTNNSIDSGATSSNDPLGALMKSMEGPTKQQM